MAFTLSREKILNAMVKLETTGGTDAAPSGGTDDLALTNSPNTFTGNVDMIDVNSMGTPGGYFTRVIKDIAGRRWATQRMQFFLRGSGSAGVTAVNGYAAIDAALQSSGMKATTVASTSITYAPDLASTLASGGEKRATIWAEHHGEIHKTVGAYGNINIQGNATSGALVTYDAMGLYQEPTAGSISGWTGTGGADPKAFLGMSCTLTPSGGSAYTVVGDSFTFDTGVARDTLDDFNDSTGVKQINFLDANPTASITIAMDTDGSAVLLYGGTASNSLWKMLTARTTLAVSWALNGGAGNTITFTAGEAEISGPLVLGTTRRYRTVTIPLKLSNSTAGSDFSIAVT